MKGLFWGLLLLLAGCTANHTEQKSPIGYEISQQHKETSKNDATVIGRFADTGPLTFCFYELSSKYLLEFKTENGWQIKNVPEGTYWLGMIKKRNENTCPTVWHDLKMYFDVKEEEVVYIGDFSFNEQKLDHAYRSKDLNKFIKREQKSMKGKVKTRRLRRTD